MMAELIAALPDEEADLELLKRFKKSYINMHSN